MDYVTETLNTLIITISNGDLQTLIELRSLYPKIYSKFRNMIEYIKNKIFLLLLNSLYHSFHIEEFKIFTIFITIFQNYSWKRYKTNKIFEFRPHIIRSSKNSKSL